MTSTFYTSVEKYGNIILHTYYENGRRKYVKEKYQPYLFLEDDNGEYRYMIDNSVKLRKQNFADINTMRDWLKEKKDISNFKYYGMEDVIGQFIADEYFEDIKFDKSLINSTSIDIEVDISEGFSSPADADAPITCITGKSSKSKNYWLFYYEDKFENDESVTGIPNSDIMAVKCKDEVDMLKKFIMWWSNDYPDVITGWNVDGYDIPYTVNRIRKVLGEQWVDKLSYWGYVKEHTYEAFGNEQTTYRFSGMTVLDYLDIFKKFGVLTYGTPASFKLDHIAYVILGDRKVSYDEYGDLNGLWQQNKNLYYQYNIKDTALIQRFEDETALLNLVYTVAYSSGVNLVEALGTVFLWDNIINRYCLQQGLVIPSAPKRQKAGGGIVGGYVKDPQVGLHKFVVSYDLNSLYPHLMMQYNISPETFIGHKEGRNVDYFMNGGANLDKTISMCANGAMYRNDVVGIIPKIIDEKYARRSSVKKEMLKWEQKKVDGDKDPSVSGMISSLDSEQMAIKVQMNGLYGAMANENFRYFMLVMAEGITTSGQLSVKWSAREGNKFLNDILETKDEDYVITIDTDSNYYNMEKVVKKYLGDKHTSRDASEKFLDVFCKEKMDVVIEKGFERLAKTMNAKRNAMKMKREKICGAGIFVAKKRYCLLVYNSEGVHYPEPKVAVTGIESVRSNTPEICKEALVESFRVMLTSGEEATQQYIETFKTKFMKADIGSIGRITGVKGIEDYTDPNTGYYQKGCPIHVRASFVHNKLVEDKGLKNSIPIIRSGDKIKYTYLKVPNPVGEDVIGFMGDDFPQQFDLDKYVDYKLQFEKVFVSPLEKVMKACGWSTEKVDNLEDFFG